MSAPASYALSTTVARPYEDVLAATREALAAEGFGVLTEIDIQATLRSKLGVEVSPQVILGACRPALAHAALELEPSLGLLLPCNVVVRALGPTTTVVEAADPQMLVGLTGNPALAEVANEASRRLRRALTTLTQTPE